MKRVAKMAWPYRALKAYIRFYHDKVCYRKTYVVDAENVPEWGTPLLIVSNHQNGSSDPLGIVMSFRDRKVNVITRADVFAIHPVANWFLRAIGLLPAFRINHEGEEALGNNAETFKVSEKALLDGETVVMYPEAGHQDKHWLGTFSYGYTRLAFEAAEMGNFEKEIFILPACNHYDDYFGIQNELMIRYGKPISLKPYYELYKTKPRTAQREVNPLWVASLYPGIFMLAVAKYFSIGRMKDRMMESTFLVCLSILFWIPIFSILTFVLMGIFFSWIAAAAWVLLLPAIFIFAWCYARKVKRLGQDISWLFRKKSGDVSRLGKLRERMYSSLDSLLK